MRPAASSFLQLGRSPGQLPSLSRPISRFLLGRPFSLAKVGRVLLVTTRRGIDRNGIAKSRVVCGRGCGPVCSPVSCHGLSVAERASLHGAKRRNALARPPKAPATSTLAHVWSLLLPRGRDDDPVRIFAPGRRARPRVFLELNSRAEVPCGGRNLLVPCQALK